MRTPTCKPRRKPSGKTGRSSSRGKSSGTQTPAATPRRPLSNGSVARRSTASSRSGSCSRWGWPIRSISPRPTTRVRSALRVGPFKDAPFQVVFRCGKLALDVPSELVNELGEPDKEGRWKLLNSNSNAVSFKKDSEGNVLALLLHKPKTTFELPRDKPVDVERPEKVSVFSRGV